MLSSYYIIIIQDKSDHQSIIWNIHFPAPSAPPADLSLSSTFNSIDLTWSPPAFEDTNGLIKYYLLMIKELNTNIDFTVTSNSTQATIGDLHPHYSYKCSVSAYTIAVGPFSDPSTIQLEEAGRCL